MALHDLTTTTYAGHQGLALAADVGGRTDAPPVILLHGGGQTRHSWRKAAHELIAQGWRVASVDLRGHGDSAWAADGDYSLEAFAGDVVALARQFPRPPALIGASLGGVASLIAAGQQAAAGAAPLASALVLVDVVPNMRPEGTARIKGFMTAYPDGFATLEAAADAIAEYLPHRPRPKSTEGLKKNLRHGPDGRWRWHWDPAFGANSKSKDGEGMRTKMESACRHIRIPTLVVRGGNSELVDADSVAQLQALIPHAESTVVSGAAHMVAGDRNDSFNAAIEAFLERTLKTRSIGEAM